ncbi:glycoside hydrolase superfamily [Cokeromyces recurvatus]|uniref:glycoside hydrolase superfamily n=1 Tax=Cokeromyces recurvatus TaxID=90255 RepID=UPI00221ED1AD|nr:glycoside hydrolase superfamily [Cokeromyces recurvatus]KAI7905389.1 glycoside hydrolase superfamily [Cokeromyces recurvatus]
MCGFDGLEPPDAFLDLIRHEHLGNIILFSRNIANPVQVRQLTQRLQQTAYEAGHKRPLLIAVDQENGVVSRLGSSAGTYLPGGMALGSLGSTSSAYQVASATARELRALGLNWNLAPVLDVNNNPLNPVIGVRSYSEDPHWVSLLGLAQVEGYQRHGVVATVKHFPGHGDTATDSHLGVPIIDKTIEELDTVELIPFRKAIEAKGHAHPSSVMVAHILVPSLSDQPASISSSVVTRLLRERMGFEGVVVTDCLEMDAIKDTVGVERGALMALQAGNDIAIISHTLEFQQKALETIKQALSDNLLNKDAIRASLKRIANLKDQYLSWEQVLLEKDPRLDIIGCQNHVDLSKRLYKQVPSIVRNKAQVIPVQLAPTDKILFLAANVPLTLAIDSEPEPFNSMYESIRRRHLNTNYIIFNEDDEENDDAIKKKAMDEASLVIVGTANANLHSFQSNMVKLAAMHAKQLVVIAVINPYDLLAFETEVDTYVVTYEYTPPAHEAAIQLIFGETQPIHKPLPVTITLQDVVVTTTKITEFRFGKEELRAAYELWNVVFTEWPLDFEKFCLVLCGFHERYHVAIYDDDGDGDGRKMIGFAATQQISGVGQLALLMVRPNYRRKGLGTQLNDSCLDVFRQAGCHNVMLGATYPRFFCGIPDPQFNDFFKHRGYTLSPNLVWDLMSKEIEHYQISPEIKERLQNVTFETLKGKDQFEELLNFQKRYFSFWVSTYEHHARLGDYQDFLVARDLEGRIIGSLILYTTGQSHPSRTDLIWTDLFGYESGGLACVGVSKELRGKGIGIGLVAHANQELKQRGVKKAIVDWVDLVDFYNRTGYQKWRSYRLAEIK